MHVQANLGVGFAKLTGELVSAALVDRFGRRLMVVGGNVLMTFSIVGIALSFQCVLASLHPTFPLGFTPVSVGSVHFFLSAHS
jgi:MFS family permease